MSEKANINTSQKSIGNNIMPGTNLRHTNIGNTPSNNHQSCRAKNLTTRHLGIPSTLYQWLKNTACQNCWPVNHQKNKQVAPTTTKNPARLLPPSDHFRLNNKYTTKAPNITTMYNFPNTANPNNTPPRAGQRRTIAKVPSNANVKAM